MRGRNGETDQSFGCKYESLCGLLSYYNGVLNVPVECYLLSSLALPSFPVSILIYAIHFIQNVYSYNIMYIPQLSVTNGCTRIYYMKQSPINKFPVSIINNTVCLTLSVSSFQFILASKLSQRCCRRLTKRSREAECVASPQLGYPRVML